MMVHQDERRSAQRTVRATVSSGGRGFSTDGEIVVRNPAPDASPPGAATGTTHYITINSGTRY